MGITKTIGKNTVGDNKSMQVRLHNYYRSTHDLSYVWKNTQAPGTLVPFLSEYVQKGDTHEIDLSAMVLTHPTIGPLFGSFKLQLDVFIAPIRLYQKMLHNNALGIGLDMSKVKLPIIQRNVPVVSGGTNFRYINLISSSALLAYLGIRGWGKTTASGTIYSKKNGIPLLAYWDIYKNYYANKQEEKGVMIDNNLINLTGKIGSTAVANWGTNTTDVSRNTDIEISWTLNEELSLKDFTVSGRINQTDINDLPLDTISTLKSISNNGKTITATMNETVSGIRIKTDIEPTLYRFNLSEIDDEREKILSAPTTTNYIVGENNSNGIYSRCYKNNDSNGEAQTRNKMQGLAIKTYQSDIFNNWVQTEWLDGDNGINAITSIDTSSGEFTLDTLNLAQKVYNMLNRIAVSDGSYRSWLETVFTGGYTERTETPIYYGGMSQEVVFEEVISSSAAENEPLGTLAGRGRLAGNKKGGKIVIKVEEPSWIIGICSLTPRIDYSQGNNFTCNWLTMDDLHKPALDGIGFQDLTTEKMAWWTETWDDKGPKLQKIGKTVAWIDYMTNYNKNYGEFASGNSEDFMVLDRDYRKNLIINIDKNDFSTYIDPGKFNGIFADTKRNAMNFWIQIGVKWQVRRLISAKQIPNL